MPRDDPFIDPEYQRYRQAYPRFPGVQTCLQLLGRRNVNGGYWEVIFHDLAEQAPKVLDELMVACRDDTYADVRWMILEILGQVNAPQTLPIFAEYLFSEQEAVRDRAAHGLAALNTKEARRLLWEARTSTFPNEETTADFRRTLDKLLKKAART